MSAECISCPDCRTTLKIPATAPGSRVKCPRCGAVIAIPADSLNQARGTRSTPRGEEERASHRPAGQSVYRPKIADRYDEDNTVENELLPRRSKRKKHPAKANKAFVFGVILGGGVVLAVAILIALMIVRRGFLAETVEWQEFSPPAGEFRISMPGKPVSNTEVMPSPAGSMQIETHTVVQKWRGREFVAGTVDFPSGARVSPAAVFQGQRDGMMGLKKEPSKVVGEKDLRLEGMRGREYVIEYSSQGMCLLRVYIHQRPSALRAYVLAVAGLTVRHDMPEAKQFFDSFSTGAEPSEGAVAKSAPVIENPPVFEPAPKEHLQVPALRGTKKHASDGGTDRLAEALFDLQSPNQLRQMAALQTLEGISPNERRPEVVKAVEPFLDSPHLHTCRLAISVLAKWGGKDSVPRLLKMLDHADVLTRAAAMRALGEVGDERAAQPIAGHLPEIHDRIHASSALKALGPVAEKAVQKYLQHADQMVRGEACRILKEIGTQDSVPDLQKLAADRRDLIGSRAAQDALNAISKRK